MSDKTIPEPKWPKEHAYGAVLGQEYEIVFQLIKDHRPLVHTIHAENRDNLKAVADHYGMATKFTEISGGLVQMEVLE